MRKKSLRSCQRCLSTSLSSFVFVKDAGTRMDYFRCRGCGYVWTEDESDKPLEKLDDRPPLWSERAAAWFGR